MDILLAYVGGLVLGLLALWLFSFVFYRLIWFIHTVMLFFYHSVSWFFFFTNWLQRWLSKPWRVFFHHHHFSDSFNCFLRPFLTLLQIPLYIVLTPLRFGNAVFFNLFTHLLFETFNYFAEFSSPKDIQDKKPLKRFWLWTIGLPKRFVVYICWHWTLTIIESIIWTLVDTVYPALTLYHGTTREAAENIVADPSRNRSFENNRYTGNWWVGGGNYAGDGIYFAPAYSTAQHYSSDVIIVSRVSLGRVLDLAIASKYLYNLCGKPNARDVTRWGLSHQFTTGEWWREGRNWWEYCMFDPGNRYNFSWRIRPLYVIEKDESFMNVRIYRGMAHWLFRKMVLNDLFRA